MADLHKMLMRFFGIVRLFSWGAPKIRINPECVNKYQHSATVKITITSPMHKRKYTSGATTCLQVYEKGILAYEKGIPRYEKSMIRYEKGTIWLWRYRCKWGFALLRHV